MVSKQGILLWLWCCAPAVGWPLVRFDRPEQSLRYRQGSASEDDYASSLSETVLPQVTKINWDEATHSEIKLNTDSSQEDSVGQQEENSYFAEDLRDKLNRQQVKNQRNLMANRFQMEIKDRFHRIHANDESIQSQDLIMQQPASLERKKDTTTKASNVDRFQSNTDSSGDPFHRDIMTRWSVVEFNDRVQPKVDSTLEVETPKNDKFRNDLVKRSVYFEEEPKSEPTTSSGNTELNEITTGASLGSEVPFFLGSGDVFGLDFMNASSSEKSESLQTLPWSQKRESEAEHFHWPNPSKILDNFEDQLKILEPMDNVSNDALKGAALMGLMVATVGSGGLNLVVGGSAAALTSYLALTKGTPGEVVRATGSSMWDIAVSTVEAAKVRHSSRGHHKLLLEQNETAPTNAEMLVNNRSGIEENGSTTNLMIVKQIGSRKNLEAASHVAFRRKLMAHRFALEQKEREVADEVSESENFVPFFLGDGYYEHLSDISRPHGPASSSVAQPSKVGSFDLLPPIKWEAPKIISSFPVMMDRLKKRLQLQSQVVSLEAELDVDDDTIKGATLAGLLLGTIGSGGFHLPISASVAAFSGCLALTKGAAGEVSRAIGDYAWEVVLSAREVLTPERRQVLKKDFAEGWLQFGLTLVEGTVTVANTTKEAIADYEKRMTDLENQRKLKMLELQQSVKQEAFLRSMMKTRFSLQKAERLLEEQKKLHQKTIHRQQRDQALVEARRGLMVYRFALESEQRVKQAEALKKAQLLAVKVERDRVELNSRREMMLYRFALESEQRTKQAEALKKAQLLAEKVERDRVEVKSRREMMLYRFALESEQRVTQADALRKAQLLEEKGERDRVEVKSRREMMIYRLTLETEQRTKQAESLKNAGLLLEKAERDRVEVNSRREMMLYRFALESKQRAMRPELLNNRDKLVVKSATESANTTNEEEDKNIAISLKKRNKVSSNSIRSLVRKFATVLVLSYVDFLYTE